MIQVPVCTLNTKQEFYEENKQNLSDLDFDYDIAHD